MEELKVVMLAIQSMADTGLTAFIWWLVMDKFIWWLLCMSAVGAIALLVRYAVDSSNAADAKASKQEGWLRTLRDVVDPRQAGSSVADSEFEAMLRIMQRGVSVNARS